MHGNNNFSKACELQDCFPVTLRMLFDIYLGFIYHIVTVW
jgi:hypothetical protein